MAEIIIQRNRKKGVALALLAWLSFGLMNIVVVLTPPAVGIMEQTFFRNLPMLIGVAYLCHKKRIAYFGKKEYYPHVLARSVCGFFAVLMSFYSTRHAAIADVTIMYRMDMFTITAVSAILLHEKLGKVHILAMAAAFLGAFIAANPRFDSTFLPMLTAFGVALCDTVSYPMMSYLAGRIDSLCVLMGFCSFSMVGTIPFLLTDFVVPQGTALLNLLLIGLFAGLGQVLMTFSYRYAPAGELSIYSQLAIVMNAILGFLFLGQVPGSRTIIGGSLVLAASIGLCVYKQHHENKT